MAIWTQGDGILDGIVSVFRERCSVMHFEKRLSGRFACEGRLIAAILARPVRLFEYFCGHIGVPLCYSDENIGKGRLF